MLPFFVGCRLLFSDRCLHVLSFVVVRYCCVLLCVVMVCRCWSVLVDILDGACCLLFVVLMYLFIVVSSFLMLQVIVVGVCGWLVSFADVCR